LRKLFECLDYHENHALYLTWCARIAGTCRIGVRLRNKAGLSGSPKAVDIKADRTTCHVPYSLATDR